jgi:hypothetical protein
VLYAKRQLVYGFEATKVLFEVANANIIRHAKVPRMNRIGNRWVFELLRPLHSLHRPNDYLL